MKAEVRDDVIKLESFVLARFKYEKYINILYESGGYCFLDQFLKYYGKVKGRHLVEQLIKNGFIKTKAISNYKFCYLTDMSLRYILLKNSEKEYESKNKVNVQKLTSRPSDKVLFSSAIKFACINENKLPGKTEYKDQLRKIFNKLYNPGINIEKKEMQLRQYKEQFELKYKNNKEILEKYIKPMNTIYEGNIEEDYIKLKKEIQDVQELINQRKSIFKTKTELDSRLETCTKELNSLEVYKKYSDAINKSVQDLKEEVINADKIYKEKKADYELNKSKINEINEAVERSVKKAIDYYNKSKIIFMITESEIKMIILDTGTVKKASSYIILLNEFKAFTNTDIKNKIVIISYSENRANILRKSFEELLSTRKKALIRIKEYESKYGKNGYNGRFPGFYNNSVNTIKNIPELELEIIDTAFYMEKYKENVGLMTEYIKPKDKDRFDQIKKSLKKRENEK